MLEGNGPRNDSFLGKEEILEISISKVLGVKERITGSRWCGRKILESR